MSTLEKKVEPAKKKKVLLADDHPLMRQGIAQLINREPDLEVVAEAEDVHEAMAAIETHHPDIVVADFTFKESNAIELIKDIRIRWPHMAVLVLTMHNENFYAEWVLHVGARGYVTKGEPPGNVIEAIHSVLNGRIYVSEKIASQMLDKMVGNRRESGGLLLDGLSDREFEVFEQIGRGLEMREIAKQFHLSIKTVEAHRDNIRKKLNFDSSTELLKHAIQWFQFESGR
jgi:DNA-binding NarL/FixJ family response regulator